MATTLPGTLHEQWNPDPPPTGGFSLNHIMFGGGIGVWVHEEVGGLRIRMDRRGQCRPQNLSPPKLRFEFGVELVVAEKVGAAAAETRVLKGYKVASKWRLFDSERAPRILEYNCTVPPTPMGPVNGDHCRAHSHARATLTVPWSEAVTVFESGVLVWPLSARIQSVGIGQPRVDIVSKILTLPITGYGQFQVRVEGL